MTPTDSTAPSCAHDLDAFGILRQCHDHILSKLEVLEAVAVDLERRAEFSDAELARLCDVITMLDTAIPIHSADEEQTLFPALRARPPFEGTEGTPMDCMEQEHGLHKALMIALKRAIMKRDPAATATAARHMVTEYRGHIDKENSILFPMAQQVLSDPAEVRALTLAMQARRRALDVDAC